MSVDLILPAMAVRAQPDQHKYSGQKRPAKSSAGKRLNTEQKQAVSFLTTYNELIGQFINVSV